MNMWMNESLIVFSTDLVPSGYYSECNFVSMYYDVPYKLNDIYSSKLRRKCLHAKIVCLFLNIVSKKDAPSELLKPFAKNKYHD